MSERERNENNRTESQKSYTRYEENLKVFSKWKNSRFLLIRITYSIAASVWALAMMIGGFLAWLIATLFI